MDGQGGLPWQWILEHLIDIKDIGLPILREIISLVPNIIGHGSLQKRIAVRYLEEVAVSDNLDEHAIPLLVALVEDGHIEEPLVSSKIKNLLLRVQVEAVLSHIRKKPKDWEKFSQALHHYFPAESQATSEMRAELLTLLQSSNQENKGSEVLEAYSVARLRQDLFQCINSEKAHFKQTFICQLLHDFFAGKYCHIEGSVGAQELRKDDSGGDILSPERNTVGSDDETVIGGRNSDADSEEAANSREGHSTALLKDKVEKSCTVRHHLKMLNGAKVVMKHSHSLDAVDEANIYKGKSSPIDLPSALCSWQRDKDAKISISQTNGKEVQVNNDSWTGGQFQGPQNTAISQRVEVLHREFCHKCGNPGMLLCCVGCPVAVHRSCLGSILTVPEQQHWYCPICSQKRAAEALLVAQEEERVASERLAKFLATFDKQLSDTQTVLSRMLDKDGKGKSSVDPKTDAVQEGLRMPSQQDVSPSEVAGDSVAAHVTNECCPKNTRNNDGIVPAKSAHMIDLTEQIAEDIDGGDAESSRRKNMRLPKKPDGSNATWEILEAGPCKEDHVLRIHNDQEGDLQTTSMNTAEAIVLVKDHFHKADGECHDSGLEEDGEDKRVRRRTRTDEKSSRQTHVPGMRRKRLRWSKEEEDTLKEGVKKFSRGNGEWGFQWTRILEFGQGRFHPGRTVVDLKDKWRNLARAS